MRKRLKNAQKSHDGLVHDINIKNRRIRSARNDMRLMRGAWKVRMDEIERQSLLGRGSQGEVWKVILRNKLPCAMKTMISSSSRRISSASVVPSNSSGSSTRTNVKSSTGSSRGTNGSSSNKFNTDEAEFLMRIRHPRLVMFMGFGYDTDKSVFILTEYMEEGTLSQALYERSGEES